MEDNPVTSPAASAAPACARGDDVLVSRRAGDPELAGLIGPFVAGLAPRCREMNEALAAGDLGRLGQLAHQVRVAAGGYGYPLLGNAAAGLEAASRGADREACWLWLAGFASVCQAAQRGWPSSCSAPPAASAR